MARFRGTVQGGRSKASRLGHSTTGLDVTANGWNIGVRARALPKPLDDERDMIVIRLNGGSTGAGVEHELGTLQETHDGRVIFTLSDTYAQLFGVEYQTATVRKRAMSCDDKWEHATPAYEDEPEPYDTGTVEDYEDWGHEARTFAARDAGPLLPLPARKDAA